jgi:hypothetical protein
MKRFALSCLVSVGLMLAAARPVAAAWNPQAYGDLGTLEILTVGAEEGEHWSTLWLVVVDGQVYLRLGSRAAERVEKNTTAPIVKVRVGGEEFERVRAEAAPDLAERVADAMAEKYTSDLLIRFFPHPLTVRLVPEEAKP